MDDLPLILVILLGIANIAICLLQLHVNGLF